MHPIPCQQCGYNFMRYDMDANAPRLCNNCNKKGKKMAEAQFIIECDHQTLVEIEEYCVNKGIKFSEYFIELHKKFVMENDDFNSQMKEKPTKKTRGSKNEN